MNPKVKDKGSYKQVQDLLDLESGLSSWEVGFIESIVRQLEDGVLLTEKQKDKLSDIEERLQDRDVNDEDEEC